jgi:hypothetical protein
MSAVKSIRPVEPEAAFAVEGEIRELLRDAPLGARKPRVDNGNAVKHPVSDSDINSLVARAGRGSVKELDNFISDLQRVRDHLTSERERIKRAIAKHIHASQATMESVKVISDSIRLWKEEESQTRS